MEPGPSARYKDGSSAEGTSLLCDHGVMKRNDVSSLESHGKALEKRCLPGVFCDSGDRPANYYAAAIGVALSDTTIRFPSVCLSQLA